MTSDDKDQNTNDIGGSGNSVSINEQVGNPTNKHVNIATTKPVSKSTQKKPKPAIHSLYEFIRNAYNAKGSRLSLSGTVERNIAKNWRFSESEEKELNKLAADDVLLKIPPQILLIARKITGYPLLKSALHTFAVNALEMHPVFKQQDMLDCLHNLPSSIRFDQAVSRILSYTPNTNAIKTSDGKKLRLNAALSLALYSYNTQNYSLPTFIGMLSSALWEPMAQKISNETDRLRSIMDTEKVEGLGIVCQQFRKQAGEQVAIAEKRSQELEAMSVQKAKIEHELKNLKLELQATSHELESLRVHSETLRLDSEKTREIELTHLRDDLEKLRSRFVRRLEADLGELETGLSALLNQTPRLQVMIQRAESVIDSQRRELDKLKGI